MDARMLVALLRALRPTKPEAAAVAEALLGARTAGVAPFRDALPACDAEVRRARRYERPLALLAITLERVAAERDGEPAAGSAPSHLSFFLLGSLLRETMRELDIVTYLAEHQLYFVVLPESGTAEVRGAVRRISAVAQERMKLRLRAGIAEFPKDGATLDALLAHARGACGPQLLVERLPMVKEVSGA